MKTKNLTARYALIQSIFWISGCCTLTYTTPLLQCYFSEPLSVSLETNNLHPHLHFLLVIYLLVVPAFSGLKSFTPRPRHSPSPFTDDD